MKDSLDTYATIATEQSRKAAMGASGPGASVCLALYGLTMAVLAVAAALHERRPG